jgi:hypothetical protein
MDKVMGQLIDTLDRVDADSSYELGNASLLNQTVTAASNAANTTSDVSFDGSNWKDGNQTNITTKEQANANGLIDWGGKMGSLTGTGGVAILEAAKDAITTFVGNISGVGANEKANTKIVSQKMGQV